MGNLLSRSQRHISPAKDIHEVSAVQPNEKEEATVKVTAQKEKSPEIKASVSPSSTSTASTEPEDRKQPEVISSAVEHQEVCAPKPTDTIEDRKMQEHSNVAEDHNQPTIAEPEVAACEEQVENVTFATQFCSRSEMSSPENISATDISSDKTMETEPEKIEVAEVDLVTSNDLVNAEIEHDVKQTPVIEETEHESDVKLENEEIHKELTDPTCQSAQLDTAAADIPFELHSKHVDIEPEVQDVKSDEPVQLVNLCSNVEENPSVDEQENLDLVPATMDLTVDKPQSDEKDGETVEDKTSAPVSSVQIEENEAEIVTTSIAPPEVEQEIHEEAEVEKEVPIVEYQVNAEQYETNESAVSYPDTGLEHGACELTTEIDEILHDQTPHDAIDSPLQPESEFPKAQDVEEPSIDVTQTLTEPQVNMEDPQTEEQQNEVEEVIAEQTNEDNQFESPAEEQCDPIIDYHSSLTPDESDKVLRENDDHLEGEQEVEGELSPQDLGLTNVCYASENVPSFEEDSKDIADVPTELSATVNEPHFEDQSASFDRLDTNELTQELVHPNTDLDSFIHEEAKLNEMNVEKDEMLDMNNSETDEVIEQSTLAPELPLEHTTSPGLTDELEESIGLEQNAIPVNTDNCADPTLEIEHTELPQMVYDEHPNLEVYEKGELQTELTNIHKENVNAGDEIDGILNGMHTSNEQYDGTHEDEAETSFPSKQFSLPQHSPPTSTTLLNDLIHSELTGHEDALTFPETNISLLNETILNSEA